MRNDIAERFDVVMSHLKPVEPSVSFDQAFKARLGEAVIARRLETPLERALHNAAAMTDEMRYAIIREKRALAGAVAGVFAVLAIGTYIYAIQPACPTIVAKEGIVLVRAYGEDTAREIETSYRLKAGDTILAKADSQADIAVSNKYEIRIKEGTALKVASLTPRIGKGKAVFQLAGGRMLVNVEEGFKGSKFIVDTRSATATALGTKFSVDFSSEDKSRTEVNVLQGKVKVESLFKPEKILLARQTVTVDAGQKTEVLANELPKLPERLVAEEWARLDELYQLGKKPQVMLLIKNTPDRVIQLLAPCAIYISDEKPREIPKIIEDAVIKIGEAVNTGDRAKHLEGIRLLERITEEHPNPKYDVQLLLYIGTYYEYLSLHDDAITAFSKVIERYSHSSLASIAQCAIAIIYDDKLNDKERAKEEYLRVLKFYPNSLEAIWAEERLSRLIKHQGARQGTA